MSRAEWGVGGLVGLFLTLSPNPHTRLCVSRATNSISEVPICTIDELNLVAAALLMFAMLPTCSEDKSCLPLNISHRHRQ